MAMIKTFSSKAKHRIPVRLYSKMDIQYAARKLWNAPLGVGPVKAEENGRKARKIIVRDHPLWEQVPKHYRRKVEKFALDKMTQLTLYCTEEDLRRCAEDAIKEVLQARDSKRAS